MNDYDKRREALKKLIESYKDDITWEKILRNVDRKIKINNILRINETGKIYD